MSTWDAKVLLLVADGGNVDDYRKDQKEGMTPLP
jgi:hypothetical protein